MAAVQYLKVDAALSEREAKLCSYLERVTGQGLVSPETANSALQAWEKLSVAEARLQVPDACPGPDGSLLYTWDRDEHHLELEIGLEEPPTFFYADRKAGVPWEAPFEAGSRAGIVSLCI